MANIDVLGGQQDGSNNASGQDVKVTLNNGEEVDLLRSIDSTLKQIYKSSAGMSQANLRNSMPGRQYDTGYSNGDKWKVNRRHSGGGFNSSGREFKGVVDEFEDGLREALMESFLGSGFKDNVSKHLQSFEQQLGVNLKDVPKALGKDLMKGWLNNVKKNNPLASSMASKVDSIKKQSAAYLQTKFGQGLVNYDREKGTDFTHKYMSVLSQGSAKSSQSDLSNPDGQSLQDAANSSNVMIDQYSLIEAISTNVEIIAQYAKMKMSTASAKNKLGKEGVELPEVRTMASLKEEASANLESKLQSEGQNIIGGLMEGQGLDAVVAGVKNVGSSIIDDVGGKALGAVGDLTHGLITTAPQLALLAAGAAVVAYGLIKSLGPAIEGTKELFEGMKSAGNRYRESRKRNLELEQERLAADVKVMVEKPFDILTQAAEAWYQTWDQNLRTITATQGYGKDDLYSLMGSYADRLRNEGLTGVISSADINSNLAKVLESGLSGQVAEEFAYIATVLEAAVPTQDWFSYGQTYASIAANAIKDGQSQSQAIQYANEQMELFASNVLYASRELSGGFSSGLKDAQSLFESANKIAVSSKVGQVSTISGVLTSVSSIVGAIAPDLSSSLIDAVVNAAVGGNSSEFVALRSLAGVNASNTEFLQLLAQNPQAIFEELFRNLAGMQNMSNENYMEVAEGLAGIFGISMDALARVDFNYLADAISQMNVNNASLSENMELLASGETTTNEDMLRYQQINKYMLDEGLSYVMDNEAARAIQENMWAEQRAREIMEAEYAVNLQGSALSFLEGISQTVQNIRDFLNPFSWMKKLTNLVVTAQQADSQRDDIRQLLELGKVGDGNARALYNLTTTGQDLHLTKSLNSLMGGFSKYEILDEFLDGFNAVTNFAGRVDMRDAGKSFVKSLAQSTLLAGTASTFWTGGAKSRYDWGTVTKSSNNYLATNSFGTDLLTHAISTMSSAATSQAKAQDRFQEYINSMERFAENRQSYDDWRNAATSYGIKDFSATLDRYGVTEDQLKNQFAAAETQQGVKEAHERDEREEAFWVAGHLFWEESFPQWGEEISAYQEQQVAHQIIMMGKLDSLWELNSKFFRNMIAMWNAEFVDHANYKPEINLEEVKRIQREEKNETGDAVLALAEALTANSTNLDDPTVQTNVLLSKILLVAEAIMQQNNLGGGSSLATTLQGLGLGLTSKAT